MKMKLLLLTFASVLLTSLVVSSAFYQKKQFYPSVIYITKSGISMAALYLQAFVFVILISKLLGKIFFGQLRPAEIEHLVERMWYAVTETCLAFTVFREDFSPKFVAMFTILLFFKSFHWLAEDRVDFMERSPVIPLKFHFRMIGLLSLLSFVDYVFILYAYRYTLEKGPTAQLVFGFEYTILKLSLIVIFCRYVLHTIDSRRETPWDQKPTFMLYTDLISNFLKLVFYVLFLVLMIKVHTLPLFIIRPVYLSMRAFKKTVLDLILSRRAIHYMNTVFTTATTQDLANNDNICIICREEMIAPDLTTQANQRNSLNNDSNNNLPKCLPCGHIFHCSCLKTWFQRQQTCPTCRMDILRNVQQRNNPNLAGGAALSANVAAASSSQAAANNRNLQNTNTPSTGDTSSNVASNMLNLPGFMVPPPFPPPPWMLNSQWQPSTNSPDNNKSSGFVPTAAFPGHLLSLSFMSGMPQLTAAQIEKMTSTQLLAMQEQNRQGLEQRITTLQNVRMLLDASISLMNAFNAATVSNDLSFLASVDPDAAPSSVPPSAPSDSSPKNNQPASDSTGDKPNSVQEINVTNPLLLNTTSNNKITPANILPASCTTNESKNPVNESILTNNTEENKNSSCISDNNNSPVEDDKAKLRDLRLRKFQNSTSSQNCPSDE